MRAFANALKGLLLGWIARLWLSTLRVRFIVSATYEARDHDPARAPWVYCFFHGTQFGLLTLPRARPTSVMVSHSRDGQMQAKALSLQGLSVVRGSTSRGGARGLVALIRKLGQGHDAAFAVDGPRGPYGVVQGGALAAARGVGGSVVPLGVACSRAHVFQRAWDKFMLPWPFSRVIVTIEEPMPATTSPTELAAAIRQANTNALKMNTLGRSASNPEEAYFPPTCG